MTEQNSTYDNCSICANEYAENGIDNMVTECGHKFHSSCLIRWMKRRYNCPCCNTTLMDDEPESTEDELIENGENEYDTDSNEVMSDIDDYMDNVYHHFFQTHDESSYKKFAVYLQHQRFDVSDRKILDAAKRAYQRYHHL